MTKDEALKLALEALERVNVVDNDCDILGTSLANLVVEAITAIKQALAAPVQEPVAWEHHAKKLTQWLHCMSYNDSYFGEPAGLVKQVTAELNRLIGATPPAAPVQEPAVWVRTNGINNSGVAHYGPTCPPGWVGAATAYFKAPPPEPAQKRMHPELKKLYEDFFDKCFKETVDLALDTTPPAAQRQWVGLMQGVRVEREYVVVSVHGGNGTARELCAALIQEMKK